MRDGVVLGADVYVPRGAGPVPAIAIRHPYGRRTPEMGMAELGSFFARKGYACVVQDVRGKFSSGGVFDPAVGEVEDGYDTVDWIANAAWCNGRVGLWGESYYGFTSLAAAISGHPAVAGIAPGDIGTDWRGVWYRRRRAAAQHRRLLGDRDGRPGVRRPDAGRPVASAAGGHGGGGGRAPARTSATPSTAPPTRRGGASAACGTCSPTCACRC